MMEILFMKDADVGFCEIVTSWPACKRKPACPFELSMDMGILRERLYLSLSLIRSSVLVRSHPCNESVDVKNCRPSGCAIVIFLFVPVLLVTIMARPWLQEAATPVIISNNRYLVNI